MRVHYANVFRDDVFSDTVFSDNIFSDKDNSVIAGNAAIVIVCDENIEYDFSSDALRLALSQKILGQRIFTQQTAPTVSCFINADAITQCYSAHSKIQLCGHGTLAANAVLGTRTQSQGFNPASNQAYQYDGQRHWIKMADIEVSDIAVPDWTTQSFSTPPTHAAIAGDNRDYLILEWPPNQPRSNNKCIANLAVDFNVIKNHTERAIIATQWCEDIQPRSLLPGLSFLQRYFAPQYGNNEDSATGSAHRVAASYWHRKTGQNTFTAWQCSTAGGILHSYMHLTPQQRNIWIGGQVKIGEAATIHI